MDKIVVLKSLFNPRMLCAELVGLNADNGLTLEQRRNENERYIRNFIFGDSVYKIHKLQELCLSDETISDEVKALVDELYCEFVDGGGVYKS